MSFKLQIDWNFATKHSKEINYENHFVNLANTSDCQDIVQLAADFYLSFAICNKSLVQFPNITILPPDEVIEAAKILKLSQREIDERNERYFNYIKNSPAVKLQSVAKNLSPFYQDLITKLDNLFVDYVSAAIGGELRHHQGVTCLGKGGADHGRFIAWSRWADIHKEYGDSIFIEAESLFLDFPPGSYGGKPWANAASLLVKRKDCSLAGSLIENQTIFIDRVFNMQHNTGSFLNKLRWANFRDDNDSIHNMHDTVLKAHSSNPPDLDILISKAQDRVKAAAIETMQIAKTANLNIHGIYTS
jgi:hypothetical protein